MTEVRVLVLVAEIPHHPYSRQTVPRYFAARGSMTKVEVLVWLPTIKSAEMDPLPPPHPSVK